MVTFILDVKVLIQEIRARSNEPNNTINILETEYAESSLNNITPLKTRVTGFEFDLMVSKQENHKLKRHLKKFNDTSRHKKVSCVNLIFEGLQEEHKT